MEAEVVDFWIVEAEAEAEAGNFLKLEAAKNFTISATLIATITAHNVRRTYNIDKPNNMQITPIGVKSTINLVQ